MEINKWLYTEHFIIIAKTYDCILAAQEHQWVYYKQAIKFTDLTFVRTFLDLVIYEFYFHAL